jgi:hypothetical protein
MAVEGIPEVPISHGDEPPPIRCCVSLSVAMSPDLWDSLSWPRILTVIWRKSPS